MKCANKHKYDSGTQCCFDPYTHKVGGPHPPFLPIITGLEKCQDRYKTDIRYQTDRKLTS